jgi:hypothetical protein
MLLQMMMFPFLLIVVGGIISLIAVADPHHKRSAPRVGFPAFYAGLFSLILSWGLGLLCEALAIHDPIEAFSFLGGFVLGMIGGAFFGYRLALGHKRQIVQSTMELDGIQNDES